MKLLPWLFPLWLLTLPRNRNLRAAAVLLPGLGVMACAEALGVSVVRFTRGEFGAEIGDGGIAMAAGLAAAWLLTGEPGTARGRALHQSFMATLFVAFCGHSLFGTAFPLGVAICFALLCTRRTRSLARLCVGFFAGLIVAGLFLGLFAASSVAFKGQTPFPMLDAALMTVGGGAACCIPLGTFILFTRFSPEYRRRWENDLQA